MKKEECLSGDELQGLLDEPGDKGDFVLDIKAARDERVEDILKNYKTTK